VSMLALLVTGGTLFAAGWLPGWLTYGRRKP
jgi:hypothetical protein